MSPRVAASCLRSGLVMYFCSWNRFSRPLRCKLEKTALDHDLLRLAALELLLLPPPLPPLPECCTTALGDRIDSADSADSVGIQQHLRFCFFKVKFNLKKHKVPPGGLDATGGPWWRTWQQPTSKVDQGLSKKKLVRMQNIPEYCCFLRNHFNDSSFTKNASIERRVERSTKTKCSSTFQTAPIFFFKRPIHCLFFTTDPSGFPFQMNPAPFSTFNGRSRR